MLEELKQCICEANLELVRQKLVIYTFGNASGVDRAADAVVIKPSGVDYSEMKPEHMVVVSLSEGKVIEGNLRPSSDTPTHLELYRAFPEIGGVVHTHSVHATAWAQACREIPALGTTHADYFNGPVPCTRPLTKAEIGSDYEANTGRVIVERFERLSCLDSPGVLVCHHGPFSWGADPTEAVHNAAILEYLAKLAAKTLAIQHDLKSMPEELLDRHFSRKHGPGRYYGQGEG